MKKYIESGRVACLICSILCFLSLNAHARDGVVSGARAKELFNKVYNMVYGPQGTTLKYNVNIIGVYKTQGLIVYKGKKIYYTEKRYKAWEDGITAYMVDTKKKKVDIYRYDDDSKDSYLSKFKYDIDNFDFSYTTDNSFYYLTAKVKDPSFFGIKSVTAKIIRSNLSPVSLTIKLAIFRTTVQISDFHSGGIDDGVFVFPKEKFGGYEFIDHRKDK